MRRSVAVINGRMFFTALARQPFSARTDPLKGGWFKVADLKGYPDPLFSLMMTARLSLLRLRFQWQYSGVELIRSMNSKLSKDR